MWCLELCDGSGAWAGEPKPGSWVKSGEVKPDNPGGGSVGLVALRAARDSEAQ